MKKMIARALGLLTMATVFAMPGASIAGKPRVKVGEPAPDFTLNLVKGGKVTLADVQGQVVILNFWATWCAPCKKELPILDAYYEINRQHGLRVYAITTEDSAPLRQLRELFEVMRIPAVSRTKGPYGAIKAVPTNIVIGRDGRIRYAEAGAMTLDKLNEVLIPLLNERAPATSQ